jgi:NAD(P)-dependent dehydrogenase (short-subunit alcohol dehydrogenase family)
MVSSKDNTAATQQVWLITGCSSGLGRALAEAALQAGHRVVATAREEWSLIPLQEMGDCLTLKYDVTQDDPQALLQQVIHWAGRLDVLVNNAGRGWLSALEHTPDPELADCMAVNFLGPYRLMRAAAPIFRDQHSGWVIQISAAAAIANYAGFSAYGAAKSALEAASESYATELQPYGIKVTLVQPGPYRTNFISRSLTQLPDPTSSYSDTVGKFSSLLAKMDGKQPGDPAAAASEILNLVQSGHSPIRLVLGDYAKKKARHAAQLRLRELDLQDAATL